VQAPDQPLKREFEAGDAVRVTSVPAAYVPLQDVPQEMPAGVEVTVPAPVPVLETVRLYMLTAKLAVME
jgi:hypothetical protein